ncbi:MAG TPA: hypothetical protein VFB13_02490 [Reyranella sp.]|jgi:hypothetical protein|nr:hypothetical protein [Reyranella sp.]
MSQASVAVPATSNAVGQATPAGDDDSQSRIDGAWSLVTMFDLICGSPGAPLEERCRRRRNARRTRWQRRV